MPQRLSSRRCEARECRGNLGGAAAEGPGVCVPLHLPSTEIASSPGLLAKTGEVSTIDYRLSTVVQSFKAARVVDGRGTNCYLPWQG